MDRRAFFTRGVGEVAQAVTKHAAQKARDNAKRWIRPPFAIDELDFLLACTRCNKCTEACPHNVIFPLSAKLGVKVFNTPAMDLLNSACMLCDGWPCAAACDDKALVPPELPSIDTNTVDTSGNQDCIDNNEVVEPSHNKRVLPIIATVSINTTSCLPYNGPECGACRVCPVEGALVWKMEKPSINPLFCIGCALCREACILEPKAIDVKSKYAKTNDDIKA